MSDPLNAPQRTRSTVGPIFVSLSPSSTNGSTLLMAQELRARAGVGAAEAGEPLSDVGLHSVSLRGLVQVRPAHVR